jgi:hypothetical protein
MTFLEDVLSHDIKASTVTLIVRPSWFKTVPSTGCDDFVEVDIPLHAFIDQVHKDNTGCFCDGVDVEQERAASCDLIDNRDSHSEDGHGEIDLLQDFQMYNLEMTDMGDKDINPKITNVHSSDEENIEQSPKVTTNIWLQMMYSRFLFILQ